MSLKGERSGHVNHLNFGGHHISETADRLRWTVNVIKWWGLGHQFITGTVDICLKHGEQESLRRVGLSAAAKTCSELGIWDPVNQRWPCELSFNFNLLTSKLIQALHVIQAIGKKWQNELHDLWLQYLACQFILTVDSI